MVHVPGMDVVVLADTNVEAACEAYVAAGIEREAIVAASAPGPAMDGCVLESVSSPAGTRWRLNWTAWTS